MTENYMSDEERTWLLATYGPCLVCKEPRTSKVQIRDDQALHSLVCTRDETHDNDAEPTK